MYTVIKAQIVDQTMTLVSIPTLASGGVNETKLECTFCSLWDGLGKVAVFYRDKDNVYHVPLVAGACVVPHEVTDQEGTFWLGVFGSDDDTTRTSKVVQLTVEQGAITQGTTPCEPTPDVYSQILANYAEMEQQLAELAARMDALVQSQGTGASQTVTLTTTVFNKNGESTIEAGHDGVHGWVRIINVNVSIPANDSATLYAADLGCRPLGAVDMAIYNGIAFGVSLGIDGTVNVSLTNRTNAAVDLQQMVIYGVFPLENPSLFELNDLRVGYDGTSYDTAGTAVREQIAALHTLLGQGGGDSGGDSGDDDTETITPPTVSGAVYVMAFPAQTLPEFQKAIARNNIGAVATVNGVAPDENGNVQIEVSSDGSLDAPTVDSGGSTQPIVLMVDNLDTVTFTWSQNYTFDEIYSAAMKGMLSCYIMDSFTGDYEGGINRYRPARLYEILTEDASEGPRVVFHEETMGGALIWKTTGFTYSATG